eukprot:9640355-Alexandrium_andersonii.AAC.1
MRSLKSFIGVWGSAAAIQPAAAFLVAEDAAAFYSTNEWFAELGKLSYPHPAHGHFGDLLRPPARPS